MSEENQSGATIKFGQGFDAPWYTPKGTPSELKAQIAEAFGMNTDYVANATLADVMTQAAVAVQGTYKAAQSPSQGGLGATPVQQQPVLHPVDNTPAPAPQPVPQQQAAPAPQGGAQQHPEGKQCSNCGSVLEWKQGVSKKTGNPYKGWKCPQPGMGHDFDFVR